MAGIALFGLWFPAIRRVSWLPEPVLVRHYLPTLWQVQGAALGLSFAILVFAFQSFSQSRSAGSLKEFSSYTPALPIVILGLASLLVSGLALLGVGRDAPYGWAGTWAIFVGLVSIALLPVLTVVLLRGLEPVRLHTARLAQLRSLIERTVEIDVLERLAFVELNQLCNDTGWDFSPLFGAPSRSDWVSIAARTNGYVGDVSIRRLKKIPPLCNSSKPLLLTRMGRMVAPKTTVILLPPDSPDRARHLSSSLLRIRRRSRRTPPLREAVELLHQQARQAIRETNPVWLEQIGEAYEELLTALPRAWARYGVEGFPQGLAQSLDSISRSPVDEVGRQLYLELQAAVASGDNELAERAVSNLYSLLLAAAQHNAEAISRLSLSLLVHGYRLAVTGDDPKVREAVTQQVASYLLEFGQLTIHALTKARSNGDHFDTRRRESVLLAESIADLSKAAIDAGRADDVKDVLSTWRGNIELWTNSSDTADGGDALKGLADREKELRIGLAFWSFRAEVDRAISRSVLEFLADSFGGTEEVLDAASHAISRAHERGEWDDWVKPPRFGGTYSPAVDLNLLEGALLLCLILITRDRPVQLGDTSWIPPNLGASQQFLSWLSAEDWKWLFPDPKVFGQARDALGESLEEAVRARRQIEIEAIRDAPLDQTRVDALERDIQSLWHGFSLVRDLFVRIDKLTSLPTKPQTRVNEAKRLVSDFERQYLVEGGTETSLDLIASEIAQAVSRQEIDGLAKAAQSAPVYQTSGSTLRNRLDEVLTHLAVSGQILGILTPTNLYIDIALGLLELEGSPQGESPLFGRPGVGNWYRGSLDGVPVVHNRILQRDRIIVVGARWGKYEEWVPSPDDPLDLELEEMATPQKNFRLTVTRWGMLTVEDPQVAAAFRIDDLQLRPEFGESDR